MIMDLGFVILCIDRNIGGVKNSLGSVRFHSYNRESICVVPETTSAEEMKNFKQIVETHKGENTVTSLINVGMKKCRHDWAFMFFSSSRLPPYIEKKLSTWVKKDTDVLFPVADRKCEFSEGSFNGVLINKKFFELVGDFPSIIAKNSQNDFELSKMFWAVKAMDHGCTFKAIVGMRVI